MELPYTFLLSDIIYVKIMSITLKNDYLEIAINPKGAELYSIVSKETGLEYSWSGNAAVWGKTSPILFPIVGTLKEDTFYYKDKKYSLPRHGFARDHVFQVSDQTSTSVTFMLSGTEDFLNLYPFKFELRLNYKLERNAFVVQYEVENKGTDEMFFSIGAHPAFKVPLIENSTYEDHYLLFDKVEQADRWPINKSGLIMNESNSLLKNTNRLDLKKSLFENDALVLKNLNSSKVSLRSDKHPHGLNFYFEGFPFMGLWAAKNADFICIEPWCGIADGVDHDQQLEHKEGIEKLSPGKTWSRHWKVELF